MSADLVIGVDLGGTKMLAGLLDATGGILETREVPTPTDSQEALLAGLEALVEGIADERVRAIGLGIPSVIEQRTGRVLGSTNIPLANLDLRDRLRDRFGLPVALENDANAATLAEHVCGAGRGAANMLMLTLGTGVGGGVVVDGTLFRGWAEFGHVVVQADGEPCQGTCTGRGHLETLVSGTAADRHAEALWGAGSGAEELVERACAGDAGARRALEGMGRLLGAGIGSLVNIFGSELAVVGGGFGMGAFDLLYPTAIEQARREAVAPAVERLRIVAAELDAEAGLVGAGLVALEAA